MKTFWKILLAVIIISNLSLFIGFIFFLDTIETPKKDLIVIINETCNGTLPYEYLPYDVPTDGLKPTSIYPPIRVNRSK